MAALLGVDAPETPRPYALPLGPEVIEVSTTQELQDALRWNSGHNHVERDLILADGVYSPDGLDNGRYHRAGVLTGGNLRGGLVRDVDVDRVGDSQGRA